MGTNYKAALIPQRIRETMHGWGKAVRKKRRHGGGITDGSTIYTETSTVCSIEDEQQLLEDPPTADPCIGIELQPAAPADPSQFTNDDPSTMGAPLLRSSASVSSGSQSDALPKGVFRSFSMPECRR